MFTGSGIVNFKADIYTFGFIVLELIYGKRVLKSSFREEEYIVGMFDDKSFDLEDLRDIMDPSMV